MPGLTGMKRILALNDEAQHCYRERPAGEDDEGPLKGGDRKDAERNREAARVWISGLEAVERKLGLQRVIDLSATPFFLRGSGYVEDAVPVDGERLLADGRHRVRHRQAAARAGGRQHPGCRRPEVPQPVGAHPAEDAERGRGKAGGLDPHSLPLDLEAALKALYGHYEQTFAPWEKAGIAAPPCSVIVCNNTSTSKLVYDFFREREDGSARSSTAACRCFATSAPRPVRSLETRAVTRVRYDADRWESDTPDRRTGSVRRRHDKKRGPPSASTAQGDARPALRRDRVGPLWVHCPRSRL